MKQPVRLFTQPRLFFNQLQWSSNHWLILLAFLALAVVETQFANQAAVYGKYADFLVARFGLNLSQALGVITVAKLALILWGAFSFASLLYIVGNLFGQQASRRVFFRRIAIVLTVLLGAFTVQHLESIVHGALIAAIGLYVWGFFLGYFALREQFALTHIETVTLGLFAAITVATSWHLTNRAISFGAEIAAAQTAQVTSAPETANRPETTAVPRAHWR